MTVGTAWKNPGQKSVVGDFVGPIRAGRRRAGSRANSDPTGVPPPPTQDCYPPAEGGTAVFVARAGP